MKYQIVYEPSQEDVEMLSKGIMKFDKKLKTCTDLIFFTYFARDESGHIVSGCKINAMNWRPIRRTFSEYTPSLSKK